MASIYLDANSTTPLLPEVLDAMRPFWTETFGNPSSIHRHGQHAHAAIERARDSVAHLLNAGPAEIVFTSGGTESDNHALAGIMLPHTLNPERKENGPPHLITTAVEHHAVLHAAEFLRDHGIEVTVLPCSSSGRVAPETLRGAMTSRTRLVSVMLANNETGILQPVQELAHIAHQGGALFHTDAVQAVGKLPVDVRSLGCDLLTVSAHKMHGPKGIGALFLRGGVALRPLHVGGPHERERRAGTENVPGIVGLGRAAELALTYLAHDGSRALAQLRDRLEHAILAAIPGSGVNGAGEPRLPNTTNLFFEDIDAEALLIALDLAGVSISAGSACQSGATDPSHVLRAMHLTEARARSSVRLSLSRLTTADEVEQAVDLIVRTVGRLRALSPGSRLRAPAPLLSAAR